LTSRPTPFWSIDWNGSLLVHAVLEVARQELAGIVARETHGHLRQVVGAKREELGLLADAVGDQRGARRFDHGAEQVVELLATLGEDRCSPSGG
jgi:hypothetical protein